MASEFEKLGQEQQDAVNWHLAKLAAKELACGIDQAGGEVWKKDLQEHIARPENARGLEAITEDYRRDLADSAKAAPALGFSAGEFQLCPSYTPKADTYVHVRGDKPR